MHKIVLKPLPSSAQLCSFYKSDPETVNLHICCQRNLGKTYLSNDVQLLAAPLQCRSGEFIPEILSAVRTALATLRGKFYLIDETAKFNCLAKSIMSTKIKCKMAKLSLPLRSKWGRKMQGCQWHFGADLAFSWWLRLLKIAASYGTNMKKREWYWGI